MKIEAMQNIKKPAYAIGAAVLTAALMSGCGEGVVRYAGETETGPDYTVELMGETTIDENYYNSDQEDDNTLLDDIGEVFCKDVSGDDIMECDGITFAKNQLLISCDIGTPYDQVEVICQNMGAKIVGYIELTSDFQIEFDEDKTLDELEAYAEDFKTYSFVRNATLNYTYEIGYDEDLYAVREVEPDEEIIVDTE